MPLDDYTKNEPGAPFRDPIAGEQDYINPMVMRAFAQEITDAIASVPVPVTVMQTYELTYNTSIVAPPGGGQVRFDHDPPDGAARMFLSTTTADGLEIHNYLSSLGQIGLIYVQDKDDATKWVRFKVAGTPVISVDYADYGIEIYNGENALAAQRVLVTIAGTIS